MDRSDSVRDTVTYHEIAVMREVTTHASGTFWLEGPGPDGHVHVHSSTAISTGTFVNTAGGKVMLEEHAFLGPGVKLLTGSHDYSKFGRERMDTTHSRNSDIVLREGVWVCGGAIVVGPCDIGAHSVVSAGAVVTGGFPPYSLIHGNPGHVVQDIRERITDPKPCPLCPRLT
jgi:acetyltransferase-like isoleucine patch superfamily enzyme